MRQPIATLAILILVAGAGRAAAQVNNQAAAEALFVEGRSLMKAKKYDEAAEKFAASDRADPSVGARINLAECYTALGKTASAWSSFKAAANLARQKQDTRRARLAGDKARALAPGLTFLVIEVAGTVDGQSVTIDGKPVGSALWGQKIPVDPGSLEIVASAPGHEPFSTEIKTGAPGAAVTARVPKLEAATTATTTEPDPEPETTPEPREPETTAPITGSSSPRLDRDPGSGRRLLALGVGAGGVVALGVGLGFGASASSKWNSAFDDGLCDEQTNVCMPAGQEQTDTARSHATISTISVAAGVALVGAGVFLYLTAPESGESGGVALAPAVGPEKVGLGLSGSF